MIAVWIGGVLLVRLLAMAHICSKCGLDMKLRYGQFGRFYSCTGFPACHNTMSLGKAYLIEQAALKTSRLIGKKEKEIRKAAKAVANMRKA